MTTSISFPDLAAGALCVWRVTHLLHAEDGPARVFVRLRRAVGPVAGQVLDCFYCLSVWVSVPAALVFAHGWQDGILFWLAVSGAACLLERATRERDPLAGLVYEDQNQQEQEKEESSHVLR